MIKYLFILIFFVFTLNLSAQNYDRALGVRGGISSGIMYKRFIDYERAVENLVTFRQGGIQFTYLRLFHEPVMLFTDGKILVYFGFGGHVGYTSRSSDKYFWGGYAYQKIELAFKMAVVGNVGIEYQFPGNPFVICIDYKPFLELSYPTSLLNNTYDFGIAIKYSF